MVHAYDKVYLDKAHTALARMLDFAVYVVMLAQALCCEVMGLIEKVD